MNTAVQITLVLVGALVILLGAVVKTSAMKDDRPELASLALIAVGLVIILTGAQVITK